MIRIGVAGVIVSLFGFTEIAVIAKGQALRACKQYLAEYRQSDQPLGNASDCSKYSEWQSGGLYGPTNVKGYQIVFEKRNLAFAGALGDEPWHWRDEVKRFNWSSWED